MVKDKLLPVTARRLGLRIISVALIISYDVLDGILIGIVQK